MLVRPHSQVFPVFSGGSVARGHLGDSSRSKRTGPGSGDEGVDSSETPRRGGTKECAGFHLEFLVDQCCIYWVVGGD